VPIYPTICKEDYEYVLNHSEAIYCFVSDIEVLEKVNKIKGNTKLKGVFTFDATLLQGMFLFHYSFQILFFLHVM